ncbi:hypothetical protein THAOC_09582 [Thalassiosira oceanica]|uniref:Uncharacterized protein n=1 Tax=Thalassiosira oceanica TaxID=159749 RepID=K0T7E4_THAOC|nr:hypothetical protein THAOC_09582 [Thalassiosira oceanica]|eukprot:EJK69191.1 hypothetical protein THAOC_09582 [Thalassiosira oceanica]
MPARQWRTAVLHSSYSPARRHPFPDRALHSQAPRGHNKKLTMPTATNLHRSSIDQVAWSSVPKRPTSALIASRSSSRPMAARTPPIRLVSAPNAAWMKVYHSNGGRCVQTDYSLRRKRHRINRHCVGMFRHIASHLRAIVFPTSPTRLLWVMTSSMQREAFESQRTFRVVGDNHLAVLSSNKSVRQPSRRGRW